MPKINSAYCPDHAAYYLEDRYRGKIWLANPDNRNFTSGRWMLWFGTYADTHVMVWEDTLDDALESAAEFLASHGFGDLFADVDYTDAAEELGLPWPSEDPDTIAAVADLAEQDTTYTESGWINSWEWGITAENPTRADIVALATE